MIDIQNVTKTYRRGQTQIHALGGISCEIETGSFNFVLGPSGSGKSTLLYLIGALDHPTSGEITIEERRLSEMTVPERDRFRRNEVGFIFQSFNIFGTILGFFPSFNNKMSRIQSFLNRFESEF